MPWPISTRSPITCRRRRGSPWSVRPSISVKTRPRSRRENVKERIVKEREFKNIRLVSEDVAEFAYQPAACKHTYRMVVVRKNLSVEKGEYKLFDDERYFFYITNLTDRVAAGDRAPGQRPLRSGEPHRATQERRQGHEHAGGQPAEQLGLHGDGGVGLEPQGLAGPGAAGSHQAAGKSATPSRSKSCSRWSSRRFST